jgi:ABC-type glutathione transport system ATPase component
MIAMAISNDPQLMIAGEPTAALDAPFPGGVLEPHCQAEAPALIECGPDRFVT